MSFQITINPEHDDGSDGFGIKIQHAVLELNVHVREDEVASFARVKTASWDERGSVAIGAAAFWSTGQRGVSVYVGHDDETWDVGLTMPVAVLDELVAELDRARLIGA